MRTYGEQRFEAQQRVMLARSRHAFVEVRLQQQDTMNSCCSSRGYTAHASGTARQQEQHGVPLLALGILRMMSNVRLKSFGVRALLCREKAAAAGAASVPPHTWACSRRTPHGQPRAAATPLAGRNMRQATCQVQLYYLATKVFTIVQSEQRSLAE